jgi:hypothetical protein
MRKRQLTERIWLRAFGTPLKSRGWTLDPLGTISKIRVALSGYTLANPTPFRAHHIARTPASDAPHFRGCPTIQNLNKKKLKWGFTDVCNSAMQTN